MQQSGNNDPIQQKLYTFILEAQQAIAAGDQQTAVLLLDQVLSLHPDHPEANYQSALIDLKIKGSEFALKKFEKAVTNKPQSESHWIGYIETLMETASLEIVLEALELGQQYSLSSKHAQDLAAKFLAKQPLPSQQNSELNINQSDETVKYQHHEEFGYYFPIDQDKPTHEPSDHVFDRIYKLLSTIEDRSLYSESLTNLDADWAFKAQLSPQRANVLMPFAKEISNGITLEVGAGCGVLTRFIGELGGEVIALEPSASAARVVSKRCEDLKNVTVINDALNTFKSNHMFDVITIIGVAELIDSTKKHHSTFQDVLSRAKSLLKDEGVLILAVDNQLGLKYFAGTPEAHYGQAMYGINGAYGAQPKTAFGQKAMTAELNAAGFGSSDLYIPLPDYRAPVSIIYPLGFSDQANDAGFQLGTIFSAASHQDANLTDSPIFSLENAWQLVSENGLAQALANSYIFVARSSNSPVTQFQTSILASYYGAQRPKAFVKEVQTILQQGRIQNRSRMMRDIKTLISRQDWRYDRYFQGEVWFDRMICIVNEPQWQYKSLLEWSKKWVSALQSVPNAITRSTLPELQLFSHLLPANYVDATPMNFVVNPQEVGEFSSLDWNFSISLPIEFVVFRGLFLSLHTISSCSKPASDVPTQLYDLVIKLMQDNGYELTHDQLDLFVELFNTFQNKAQGERRQVVNKLTQALETANLPIRPNFS